MIDNCGQTFEVICTGGAYVTSPGGGTCIWSCGRNRWKFKMINGPCGFRISSTFHRTIDFGPEFTDARKDFCDRGTCPQDGVRYYDWVDTISDECSTNAPDRVCCSSTQFPDGDGEGECLEGEDGICDNDVTCPPLTPP